MTAFAAIVPHDPAAEPGHCDDVRRALTDVYGTAAATCITPGCALFAAPASAQHPESVLLDTRPGAIVAGQVMLEERRSLALELGLDAGADAPALAVCAAAFGRRGPAFTARFNGEFAFALWDPSTRSLWAARDGLGVRQLFVAHGTDAVIVTNVLAAALAHRGVSRQLDERSLVRFLATGSLDTNRTAYAAIKALPAGHTLRIAAGRGSLQRHWTFPASAKPLVPNRDAIAGYREALERAVSDRLTQPRASILLSGGVDSTTIAAAARRSAPHVALKAFTAIYERVPESSELPLAQLAADATGIPLVPVIADKHPALHHLNDREPTPQPVDEPSLTDWRALVAAAATHSSIALYGEDGDSLFLPPGLGALRRVMSPLQIAAATAAFLWSERKLPYLGVRVRERLGLRPTLAAAPASPSWLTPEGLTLLAPREPAAILGERIEAPPLHESHPQAAARLHMGAAEYLSNIIAPEVTRQPIELRCPLLDTRVIRFVMSVAPIPWCQSKRLARHAYRDVLPRAIYARPKRGLAGFDAKLAQDWQSLRQDRLPVLPPPLDRWVDTHTLQRALADSASVGPAWRVLQLAGWLNQRPAPGTQDYLCTA